MHSPYTAEGTEEVIMNGKVSLRDVQVTEPRFVKSMVAVVSE